ncbi:MAG TPA: AsmA-like C-terminal region-containing protein [Bryobacteraceae bacterium]|nr:AsmA-like C-terminal region-containing protein [Bryobacteraceae bacterium]
MSKRKKLWLGGIALVALVLVIGAFIAASIIAKTFEPTLRAQAIQYLQDRFHSDVELQALHINRPQMSTLQILLRHGRGAIVAVEGDGLAMRFGGDSSRPPLFSIKKVLFTVDLGVLFEPKKSVTFVSVEGMEINIPPKGERQNLGGGGGSSHSNVIIQNVQIHDAVLVLLPKDTRRTPLRFNIARLHLQSVGANSAMRYDADLTIPKPPGTVKSTGNFGPWNAFEPGDTPLQGNYTFDNADLGIFAAIAGTLSSKGTFDGSLDSVNARGTTYVPNFQLKMAGNSLPLSATFEAQVDGTNGNTILQPVRATLGHTNFTTTGAVIKHEEYSRRGISLQVNMPKGDMRDLLRLSMKGQPFMEGFINMKSSIDIPPLTGKVKQKIRLDGTFDLHNAKFLKSNIQDQIDQLSRRGQGQPKNEGIDEVISKMQGSFHLENQVMTFRSLAFEVPGAAVSVAGNYNLANDMLDFHGALKLDAKLSQTMTGWKRWVLKPADPFFAKNGAGTYVKIKIEGDAHHPKFGLDR